MVFVRRSMTLTRRGILAFANGISTRGNGRSGLTRECCVMLPVQFLLDTRLASKVTRKGRGAFVLL